MADINQVLLSTQITALKVKDNFVFIGEGQHVHIHDINEGTRYFSTKVFRAAVVHGIQLQKSDSHKWMVAVFGQKSFTVLCFEPTQCKCCVLLEERCFEDWIVDAAWENDLSHVVLAMAHNSLLRCEFQNLTECCTKKFQHEDELRQVKKRTEIAAYNHERGIHEDIASDLAKNHVHTLNLDKPHGTEHQRQHRSHGLERNVVAKAESTEKCVLFCGRVVMMSGSWASVILLAGMISQQVVVWGPWGEKDECGRIIPFHRISGHQGSIFSVNFCPVQGIITTTSDDRSLRVWGTSQAQQDSPGNPTQTLPHTDPDREKHFWKTATISEKHRCYGHSARVWRSLILPFCVLSVGEDSKVCVWDGKGMLVTCWRAHDGASIWSIAGSESADKVITGGGDGCVKSWCLNVRTQDATPLGKVPWLANTRQILKTEGYQKNLSDERSSEDKRKYEVASESASTGDNEEHISDLYMNNTLFEGPKSSLKKSAKEGSPKPDFPRCVVLLGLQKFLMVMDSGKLYLWNQVSSSWCLSYEDEQLKNYVVAEGNPNQKYVALGTLSGNVIILSIVAGDARVLLKRKVCEGKVFALLWLVQDQFIVCGPEGAIGVWEICEERQQLKEIRRHTLPPCKQRWISAACLCTSEVKVSSYLVCGDRAGSLHLYLGSLPEVQHTLRSVHGRNGVTNLCIHRGLVYSTGRDGCVRCLTVQSGRLQVITVTRVSSVNWVAKLVFLLDKPLAICFHDVKLKVWSLEEDRAVAEVECGGGHRSWDLLMSETENKLTCLFLKDAVPYIYSTELSDKFLPLIKTSVNTHETMCLQVLFQQGKETIFATGGEDTTMRLHSVWDFEQHKSLKVIRSHISSVRTICLIDETCRRTIFDGDKKTTWMVSAGGRAQIKVWKSTYGGLSDLIMNPEQNLKSSRNPEMQPSEKHSSSFHDTDVICREVTSHMLRTGSNKTWKSQELTFDPETRYMDATSFWVTDTRALVALASSDGNLRIFTFSAETENLDILCCEELDHCLLKVTKVWVHDRPILVCTTTAGIVLFWDLQSVIRWTEGSNSASHSAAPNLQLLTKVSGHQSGINGLAFSSCTRATESDVHSILMATAGDDNKLNIWKVIVDDSREDLRISVTDICSVFGHSSQITGIHWLSSELIVSVSIDQRVIIWKLCSKNSEHHENIQENTSSEIHVPRERTPSAKDSQKSVFQDDPDSCAMLKPVSSCFTGVPDVKGIAVVDLSNGNTTTLERVSKRVKRIFVYGMGLQVFDVDFGNDI